MLTPQDPSEAARPHGCGQVALAELRRHLADPSSLGERHRRRLLELDSRLARIQALGGEYARVAFSRSAVEALGRPVHIG